LFGGNTPGSVNYSEIQRLTMEDPQVSLAYDDLRRAEYNLIDQRNAPYVPFWTDYWLSKYEGEQRTALWRYQRALQDAKCRMTNIAQYCTPIPMPGTGSYYR
jgi:hypothetical protein